jgi:hypothetical protein
VAPAKSDAFKNGSFVVWEASVGRKLRRTEGIRPPARTLPLIPRGFLQMSMVVRRTEGSCTDPQRLPTNEGHGG